MDVNKDRRKSSIEEKTKTSVLFSQQQLNGNSEFDLKQLYSEGGVYIYKVEYNEK